MRSTTAAILIIAAGPWLPVPGVARDAAVDEIVVTAKRRSVDLAEVSAAVSVVRTESLAAASLVTDALIEAPGVFLQQTTPGQGAAIVRGLKGSAVLHLVDGMRLNNAIFRSAPTQYLALVPVSAVQRLEVVRGTPTALYGSDAIGGVVQVVTRVPEFDSDRLAIRGSAHLAADTAELEKAAWTTLDVGNSGGAVSLGAEYRTSGNRRIGGGRRVGPSGYEVRAARALFLRTPTDDELWSLDLHWLEQPSTPRIDELVPGFGQEQASSAEYRFEPNRRLFAHARHRRADGPLDLDWSFDVAWQRIVDDRLSRESGAEERTIERNRSDLYAASLNGTGRAGGTTWIVGADFTFDRVASRRFEEALATGDRLAVAPRFPNGSTVRQAAVYGSLDRPIRSRHAVSAGLRYSHVTVDLAATDLTDRDSLAVGDLSGDIGWVFDATSSLQLLANAGFGFRAPNVFDLGTLGDRPGNRFNIPNAELDSEHVIQADLGLRYSGDRWRFEAFWFCLDYEDRIVSTATGDVTGDGRDVVQSVNAATAGISGIEAALDMTLGAGIRLELAADYVRGTQREAGADTEPADRIPPLNGHVRASFDSVGGWQLRAALRFAARQHRLSARDSGDVRIDPDGTPGWSVLDIEAGRTLSSGWRIGLAVGNLFDRRYRWHGSGIDAPGRNVAIRLQRDWAR